MAILSIPAANAFPAATPVIDPGSGYSVTSFNVTLTCSTPGAVVHYTTNGTEPTTGSPSVSSGGSVVIDRSSVLKAKAVATGFDLSATASSSYEVTGMIAAGDNFSVALKSDGTVWTWGANASGQLGDGTVTQRLVPGKISGLTGVVWVAAGKEHCLAVKNDGTVRSWGYNSYGGLGDGTLTLRKSPVTVSSLTGVVSVAAGMGHSLALKSNGTVWAWGLSGSGQVGDGFTSTRLSPVQVSGLTGIIAVAAGENHSLALKSDGTVWAWGLNNSYQLGDGTGTARTTPVQVSSLTGVVALAAGDTHSLAVKSDGTVWAWGSNISGRLGDGTLTNRSTPVQVGSLTGVVKVFTKKAFSFALKNDGTVWSWGLNGNAQLSDGTSIDRNSPVQVNNLNNAVWVAAGDGHGMALDEDGMIWSWGLNVYGQLGDGTISLQLSPLQAPSISSAVAVSAGTVHSLGLNKDGTVWASGINPQGQLGDGTVMDRPLPFQLAGVSGAVAVATGSAHSVALKSDGTVKTWGLNSNGQLGDGTTTLRASPVTVSSLSSVVSVAAGSIHTLAVKSDGTVWAWGSNGNGRLGDGTTTQRSTRVQVTGLTHVVSVAANSTHSLALKDDGTVWAWGLNSNGQLGDGTVTQRTSPVAVSGLTRIVAIYAGLNYSLALKSDGTVWAWGLNSNGQLGDGTVVQRNSPVQLTGLSRIVTLSAGNKHAVALKSDGTIWAWGLNSSGQLGDGTLTQRNAPVQLPAIGNVIGVSAGSYHTMLFKSDGTVWGWGICASSAYAQLKTWPAIRLIHSDADTDEDGMADSWEISHFGNLTHAGTSDDDADKISNFQEYLWDSDPNNANTDGDFFNDFADPDPSVSASYVSPQYHLSKISGDNQQALPHSFAQDPLIAKVSEGDGDQPLRDVPVIFNVVGGSERLAGSSVGSPTFSSFLTLRTGPGGLLNSDGLRVYGKVQDHGSQLQITVSALGQNDTFALNAYNPDLDGDGMPNDWETAHGFDPETADSTLDPDGDGLTNLQEYEQGSDPHDYYNGITPTIEVLSGNDQVGNPGSYSDPLVIRVKVSGANAFNAPVHFSVDQGGGKITTVNAGSPAEHDNLSVVTDINGIAKIYSGSAANIYYRQPLSMGTISSIIVEAGTAIPAQFNLQTIQGTPEFGVPAGSYTIEKQVSITGATGATIRYTLDGSEPNTSSLSIPSGESVWIRKTETLKAKSYLGSDASPTATALYVLTGQIRAGQGFSLALRTDGRIWTWGENTSFGKLGDGTTDNRNRPVPVFAGLGLKKAVFIGTSGVAWHSGAVDEDGGLWLWGKNDNGQLGNNSTDSRKSPEKIWVAGDPKFIAVACGSTHTIALTSDGEIYGWGANNRGQLGNGTTTSNLLPSKVSKPSGMGTVMAIGASTFTSFALDSNGVVWAWGWNAGGRLGTGDTNDKYVPTQVASSTGMPAISSFDAGDDYVIAKSVTGQIWSWGSVTGNSSSSIYPVQCSSSSGLVSAIAVSAGTLHAQAIDSSNQAWAWGNNPDGAFGTGNYSSSATPVQTLTSGGFTAALQLAGGRTHSLGVKTDGTVWAWGTNGNGELGNGSTTDSTSPVSSSGLNLFVWDDDSDADGMSDFWETFYFSGLTQTASGNYDSDGLTNLQEYQSGTNPLIADTDADGMTDGYEYSNGLEPLDPNDAFDDPDGDRVPNLWESKRGTSPQNASDIPAVDRIVNPALGSASSSDNIYSTIQQAVNAAASSSTNPDHEIIFVKSGQYPEKVTLPANKRIVLLAEQSATPVTIIAPSETDIGLTINDVSVVDGFEITRGVDDDNNPSNGSSGVRINLNPRSKSVRLVNCIIHGHRTNFGGGVYVESGFVDLHHCTLYDNWGESNGGSVYVGSNGNLRFINSIGWSRSMSWQAEISRLGTLPKVIAIHSILADGAFDALASDPRLNWQGLLTAQSPARGSALVLAASKKDLHGESRTPLPDIGADQFTDSDSDDLPDFWEMKYFSNLSKTGSGDNESPTPDGLINRYEYLMGFNPTLWDTFSTGLGDLVTAAGMADRFWYPTEWSEDPDKDGLTTGKELQLGSDPGDADSNNDGLTDHAAYQAGIDLLNLDVDGDGIPNATEIANGTSPFLADTDGDEHNDNGDAYPLDPSRWQPLVSSPGDTTGPGITLLKPIDAVLVP